MKEMFEISDLELMTYFFGIEVKQTTKGIFLSQSSFTMKILDKFSIKNCKPTSTPMAVGMKLSRQGSGEPVYETMYKSLIGSLLYLTATRPDIMFTVSVISSFMNCCNDQHFQAAKRVLRYIKGTIDHGVLFKRSENMKLIGYVDSDWAGSCDDIRSTSGYAFSIGSGMFCSSSKKQNLVAQTTAEAEYVVAASAVN
ncbi:secreted RxLR effector protein 161-like [Gossypium raimondii]|uniref:secreted RxLR effector protein 161-like n=1 Tax=Gossypium raimondii TaxID=29730 RepID=UPI00227B7013|nr:secreted RxLR effector protein 161-like [Gossypium raimondii]